MTRRSAFGLCAALAIAAGQIAPAADGPPPLRREFRGVWVATVANIDWPSKPGLSTAAQKAELLAILDKCVDLKLNAVVFQVRPSADAFYESKLEPWSEYLTGAAGQPPEPRYDPLEFAVAEAHARGLELHAWFNPYRARHPSAKGPFPDSHVVKSRPDLAKPYGKHHWLNPTHPGVQDHSIAVVLDVVRRYDVDGVHIDDYFYPYKEKDAAGAVIPFPDDDTWAAYQSSGGTLARDDWRRDAVNRFVARMYKETKAVKPWVKVGISPFGIWQPGHPPGITGFNQHTELYADAKLWWNEGWVDYLSPQLYWPIRQEKQSFPKLLAWWADENTKGRQLWPGLYTSKVTGAEKSWPAKEIVDQIEATRRQPGAGGVVHFSMKSLMNNTGGVADAVKGAYAEAAVPPSCAETNGAGPAPPKVATTAPAGTRLSITCDDTTRILAIQMRSQGTWTTVVRGVTPAEPLVIPVTDADRVVCTAFGREGRGSAAAEWKR